jgi:putative sterol carrier protein
MGQRAKPLIALAYAISAILFTGFGLVTVSMAIGSEEEIGSSFYYISFGILGFGVLLILIGLFGTLGFMRSIRTIIDKISQQGYTKDESPAYEKSRQARVIRQKMPSPLPDDQIPQPKTKPTSAKVTPLKPVASTSQPKPLELTTDESPTISLDAALQSIVDRYNLDKVKKSFNGWNETLIMRFPDIGKSFMYVVSGSEGIEFKEGDDPEAAVQVEMDSILFQKLISKQVNAIKAYSSGKMNVSGQMKNMLKLRKLMF